MSAKAQALPVSEDSPAESPGAIGPDIKVVSGVPNPAAPPAPSNDPLAVLKTMTEEEIIALFS